MSPSPKHLHNLYRFGEWVVMGKLDEGGFGQVYKVESNKTGKFAALKAEPNDVEGGSAIKLEVIGEILMISMKSRYRCGS